MPSTLSSLKDLKRAYYALDDSRAKLEEVQSNLRENTDEAFQDILDDLDLQIDEWLGALHHTSEDILDWVGRDD
jgi:5-bromo-4-chloroindolyl phosphate hydrolysis protein